MQHTIKQAFIPRAKFVLHQKVQWFPGHMRKGIRDVGKTLRDTDLVLEVHDARIPFSGRNLNLIGRIALVKPVILLLNKCDLIEPRHRTPIVDELMRRMDENNVPIKNIFFFDSLCWNARNGGYNKKFISTIIDLIEKGENANSNTNLFMKETQYSLLVMGIPNVGKSTVINRLRNVYLQKAGKVTMIGPEAGVTRSVLEKIKICDEPRKIYLYDTPGILEPAFHRLATEADREALMRCALCGNIADNVVGFELIADYLLYWLNKASNYNYVEWSGLQNPTNDIAELLTQGAVRFKMFHKKRLLDTGGKQIFPDLQAVAEKFVRDSRKGKFGPLFLDQDWVTT